MSAISVYLQHTCPLMRYSKGDFLSFNTGGHGFLVGLVSACEYGKYQIVLTDYWKPVAPDNSDTKDPQVFGYYYEMGEQSMSALDVLNLGIEEVDNALGVEAIGHLTFAATMPAAGFAEFAYTPAALFVFFDKSLQLRNGGLPAEASPMAGFEQKTMLFLDNFLAGLPAPNQLPTIKLYRNTNDSIEFFQVYSNGLDPVMLVAHWGILGGTGEFNQTNDLPLDVLIKIYADIICEKRAQGYSEWPGMAKMILQFKTADEWGGVEDLDFRNAIWDYLDKYLFWTGNGAITGGDIGSGTVNLFFETIDPGIAICTITQALKERKVEQTFIIALESWPQDNELSDGEAVIKILYPESYTGAFVY